MIVYWYGVSEEQSLSSLSFEEPSPTISRINEISPKTKMNNFSMCPAIREKYYNVFDLKFPIDITIKGFNDLKFFSDDYKELGENTAFELLRSLIFVKDFDKRLINIKIHYFFFTEEDSCLLENMPASYCDNDFSNKGMYIDGQFNFAKWCRPINFSFVAKKNISSIKFNKDDVYAQIKFHTKDKIKFKRFIPTPEFINIMQDYMKIITTKKKFWNMNNYYNFFKKSKIKKHVLKIIKQNVLEE